MFRLRDFKGKELKGFGELYLLCLDDNFGRKDLERGLKGFSSLILLINKSFSKDGFEGI